MIASFNRVCGSLVGGVATIELIEVERDEQVESYLILECYADELRPAIIN